MANRAPDNKVQVEQSIKTLQEKPDFSPKEKSDHDRDLSKLILPNQPFQADVGIEGVMPSRVKSPPIAFPSFTRIIEGVPTETQEYKLEVAANRNISSITLKSKNNLHITFDEPKLRLEDGANCIKYTAHGLIFRQGNQIGK